MCLVFFNIIKYVATLQLKRQNKATIEETKLTHNEVKGGIFTRSDLISHLSSFWGVRMKSFSASRMMLRSIHLFF